MSPKKRSQELTDRQREVLDFIVETLTERGYPPTVREIAQHFNMASGFGVQRHLETLQKKGYLRRESGARQITLSPEVLRDFDHAAGVLPVSTEPPLNAIHVPLVGQVAAGIPITAEENVEELLALPQSWVDGRGEVFMLRVKGDSMAPGIEDRDLVLVRAQPSAENGGIVVANVDGEATVKRFFREVTRIVLRADNPVYDDIIVERDFRLEGRVIGLIRFY
jgi:repressor LexA